MFGTKEKEQPKSHADRPPLAEKVAILGMNETYRSAPFDDPTWDIWGINHYFLYMAEGLRVTAWFELHNPADFKAEPERRRHWLQYGERDYPLYMQPELAADYGAEPFPRTEIERAFPRGNYQAITFSWLVAAALLWDYKEIALYGLGSMIEGEPLSGRACLEYWVGFAEGRGVKVRIPNDTDMLYNVELRGGQYAFDQPADGLGVSYMGGNVLWRKHPDLPGCEVGTSYGHGYLKFPLARRREDG